MNRIILVDDEATNLIIMQKFLSEEHGLEVFTALNGDEALELVEKVMPDIVLMDVFMPGLTGIEVTRIIRKKYDNLLMPIILITTSQEYQLKIEALSAGVDDFLSKPLDRIELITKIRLLMKNKQLHEALDISNQRMVHQLELARQVQDKLQFRGDFKFGPLEIKASYFPMEEIGGDIIALRRISEERLWVFLGDASGHGISAAMVGTLVKALLEGLSCDLECSEVMKLLNNKLVDCFNGDLDDLYVTAIFGLIDLENGTFEWVNAGHPDPVVKLKKAPAVSGSLLHSPYVAFLPLGIMPNYWYVSNVLTLAELDEIVLFSDGLIAMVGGHIEDAWSYLDQVRISGVEAGSDLHQNRKKYEDDMAFVRIIHADQA